MKRHPSSVLRTSAVLGIATLALTAATIAVSGAASAGSVVHPGIGPIHQLSAGGVRPFACNAKKTEPIRTTGGAFVIPACAGTKGKVTYGPNNAPSGSSVTVLASASDPSPSSCGSAAGETTVAYVLATGNGTGSVSYQSTNKKSTLKNAAFPQSATFTLFAYAFGVEQFSQKLGSPNAKGVLKFPSPLSGMNLPLGITFCFELDTP